MCGVGALFEFDMTQSFEVESGEHAFPLLCPLFVHSASFAICREPSLHSCCYRYENNAIMYLTASSNGGGSFPMVNVMTLYPILYATHPSRIK